MSGNKINNAKNGMNEKTVKKRIKINTLEAIIKYLKEEDLNKEDLTQVLTKFKKNSSNYKNLLSLKDIDSGYLLKEINQNINLLEAMVDDMEEINKKNNNMKKYLQILD